MWSRRIITVLLAVAFGLWDAAVSPWFPGAASALNLALPFVVVLAVFSRRERAVIAAISSGIILDVFLPSGVSFISIRYLIIALTVVSLRQHILTNRSLIGVTVLAAASVVMDRAILSVIEPLRSLLGAIIPEAPSAFWVELPWMVFIVVFFFFFLSAFSRRFLPIVSRGAEERV